MKSTNWLFKKPIAVLTGMTFFLSTHLTPLAPAASLNPLLVPQLKASPQGQAGLSTAGTNALSASNLLMAVTMAGSKLGLIAIEKNNRKPGQESSWLLAALEHSSGLLTTIVGGSFGTAIGAKLGLAELGRDTKNIPFNEALKGLYRDNQGTSLAGKAQAFLTAMFSAMLSVPTETNGATDRSSRNTGLWPAAKALLAAPFKAVGGIVTGTMKLMTQVPVIGRAIEAVANLGWKVKSYVLGPISTLSRGKGKGSSRDIRHPHLDGRGIPNLISRSHMSSTSDHRSQFLADLARLRKRFAQAARAFERDDWDETDAIVTDLTRDAAALLDKHLKAYPNVLRDDRLSFLSAPPAKSGSKRAAQQLAALMNLERALRVLDGEIRRSYPREGTLARLWRKRKGTLIASVAAAVTALVLFLVFRPQHGLTGEYYEGTEFQTLIRRRVDRMIDFDWGFAGPANLTDHFSVRWTGTVCAPADGTYEFVTRSDDGVRLWVNNKLLIDQWALHGLQDDRSKITLEKGPTPIRLDYFEYAREAQIQLRWRPDTDSDSQVIPASALSPTDRGCSGS